MLRALLVTAALLAGATASAQFIDLEPNEPCVMAQPIGTPPGLPATIEGDLSPLGDIDFFALEWPTGTMLRVDMDGDFIDSYLGLFDEDCNLLDFNDDFMGQDSRIEFAVPSPGRFVLGATTFGDPDFEGGTDVGPYVLIVSQPPPAIGSISGRLVDAVSGAPLPGDVPPFARAELFRCEGDACDFFVASESTGADGMFRFDEDSGLLEPGSYEVAGLAHEYETVRSGPFDVAAGEDFALGDLARPPPPISFSDILQCDDIPVEGGTCVFGVTINNNTHSVLVGRAWSIIEGFGTGSPLNATLFQAAPVRTVQIPALRGRRVLFSFQVPPFLPDSADFCTRVFLSGDPRNYTETLDVESLFCISRLNGEWRVQSRKAVDARRGAANRERESN